MRLPGTISFALALLPAVPAQQADPVRFARVFGDHMVLQRDQPLRVWGTAAPSSTVVVRFGALEVAGRADAHGAFVVQLPALPPNAEGRDLVAVAGTTATLHDVVVGDVWLCSGQSNMAMSLDGCGDAAAVAAADNPDIRYRPYFEHFAGTPQADLRDGAAWRPITPGTAGGCTAVGYWFAQTVQPVAGVPIGLLECTVGGTEIECWMPPAAIDEYPENAALGVALRDAIADWQRDLASSLPAVDAWLREARAAAAAGRAIPPAPPLRGHPNEDRRHWLRTTSLWNGMVHPLLPFALRGVLWYQGENNGHEELTYAGKLRAMVATWRRAWGHELPFYYVQLPNFGKASDAPAPADRGFAPCRMAQLQCARLAHVGMAVTIDCGDALDIHPKDKRTVGERLARWALRNEYGQQLEPSGPLYVDAVRDGDGMRVRFDHVGQGLMVGSRVDGGPVQPQPEAPLRRFALAGEDRQWHWAEARIDGACVIVRAAAVPEPVAVRYAFSANPDGTNLYNRDGLPASPFRSDDW